MIHCLKLTQSKAGTPKKRTLPQISVMLYWTVLLSTVIILILHTFISLSGEGNGNPLQYSCLENPMDRGAWWAAVHGVAQSRTQLSH